jgi:hypothetical protein
VRSGGVAAGLLALGLLFLTGTVNVHAAQAVNASQVRYVITLESSKRGIRPEALGAASEVPGSVAYISRATVKGVDWERLKLGFFASEDEAKKVLSSLQKDFPQAWVTMAMPEDRERFQALVGTSSEVKVAAKPQAQATPKSEVTVAGKPQATPKSEKESTASPVAAAAVAGAAVAVTVAGTASKTAETATSVSAKPGISSDSAAHTPDPVQKPPTSASVPPGDAGGNPAVSPETAVAKSSPPAGATAGKPATARAETGVAAKATAAGGTAAMSAGAAQAPGGSAAKASADSAAPARLSQAAPGPVSSAQGIPGTSGQIDLQTAADGAAPLSASEQQAVERMLQARKAMLDQDWDQAVRLLTSVLASSYTVDHMQAREFLGLARERKGQIAHAKAEYQRYLEDYPDSDGVPRVKQRLVGLVTAGETPKQARAESSRSDASDSNWDTYGRFWQYYYRDVRTMGDSDRTVDAIYTNVDLVGRYDGQRFGMLSRVNGGYRHFLTGVEDGDEGNVNIAYVELRDDVSQVSGRFGRQTSHSGGVLGRFDGAHVDYAISPWVTINGVAGYTVDSSRDSLQTERNLYGVSMDFADVFTDWDFSVFYNAQDYSGAVDRRAVGGEMRYFDERGNLLGLVDYDTYYGALNIAMLSGSWNFPGDWIVSGNLDYRRSPLITSRNALIGQQVQSMDALLLEVNEEEIRIMAADRSAEYKSAMLGLGHTLSDRMQVQAHVSMFNLSGTDSSFGVAGFDGTGNEFSYDVQVIGSSLLTDGDMSILGVRYIDGSRYSTVSMFVNSRFPLGTGFRIQPRLRLDHRSRIFDDLQEWILSPSMRIEYRLGRHSLELEAGGELWRQDGSVFATDASAYFLNLGYRLIF